MLNNNSLQLDYQTNIRAEKLRGKRVRKKKDKDYTIIFLERGRTLLQETWSKSCVFYETSQKLHRPLRINLNVGLFVVMLCVNV